MAEQWQKFMDDENDLEGNLEYNGVVEWDSIGHMSLIAELEDQFDIMMEMDDIIDINSYEREYNEMRT